MCLKIHNAYAILSHKMRVIHPGDFKALPKKKKRRIKLRAVFVVAVIVAAGYLVYDFASRQKLSEQKNSDTQQNELTANSVAPKPKTGVLKEFTGEQFHALAKSVKYPNTQLFEELPVVTGDKKADARIHQLAQDRGYGLTSIPVTSIEKINEPRLEGDDLLQPLAAIAWRDLKAAAKRDKMPLSLLSAYRSPEYQRNLFMSRLKATGVTTDQIARREADAAVVTVLLQAAIPGHSRHHTGYTIDVWCEDGSGAFVNSTCFKWISANNYKIAKETGWIPSYPEGVELQGPEPEPWEYVWVGKDLVTN